MVYDAKRNYLQAIRRRYKAASKAEKSKILDEFFAMCNYNRKYAIRVINKESEPKRKKTGPKPMYQDEEFLLPLKRTWFAADQP